MAPRRRVVITRAAQQSDELADLVRDAGFEPVVVPLIAIAPPGDGGIALESALARLAEFEWLVVTSPNGASRVRDAVAARPVGAPKIAAVGRATEAALGRAADLVPVRQVAEALLDGFPAGAGRVLLAQADGARPLLAAGLADKGWDVDVVEAYRTVAVPVSAAAKTAVASADAIVFASGSAVRAWVGAGGVTPPITVAIGPPTAAVAAELGLKMTAVASDHSLRGIVSCLLEQLQSTD